MNAHPLRLVSALSPAECIAKLNAAIDIEPSEIWMKPTLNGTHEVIGAVKGDAVWLRRRIPYSSVFQPRLEATISAHEGGTLIEGAVSMHKAGRVFMLAFLFATGAVCGIIFTGAAPALLRGHTHGGAWFGIMLPMLTVLAAAKAVPLRQRRLQTESEFIDRFLRQPLGGTVPS